MAKDPKAKVAKKAKACDHTAPAGLLDHRDAEVGDLAAKALGRRDGLLSSVSDLGGSLSGCGRLTFSELNAVVEEIALSRPDSFPGLPHSDRRHGHWVQARESGTVGRVALEIVDGPVVVLWDEVPQQDSSSQKIWGLCEADDLVFLIDRTPSPWYAHVPSPHSSVGALLGAADLTLTGVVAWGKPVPVSTPGVYLISLAEDPADYSSNMVAAPISEAAIEQLLAVCSQLKLDSRRPTPSELKKRIGRLWLGAHTVLYVGQAGTSLRTRVAQYYHTPLGARSPHAGGWFLKLLSNLDQLFVHYATSGDPVESEKRIVQAFVDAVPPLALMPLQWAFGASYLPLPFANLQYPDGPKKPHGITGATGCHRSSSTPARSDPHGGPKVPNQPKERVTLHAEIIAILIENGDGWMTTKEIAKAVKQRGIYKKRDGTSDVTPFQVHGRTKNYPNLFERDRSRVRRRR